MTTKTKAPRYSTWGLKNVRILLRNLAMGLGSKIECCRGYVSIFVITPKELILKSIFPLKVTATLLSGSRKGAFGT